MSPAVNGKKRCRMHGGAPGSGIREATRTHSRMDLYNARPSRNPAKYGGLYGKQTLYSKASIDRSARCSGPSNNYQNLVRLPACCLLKH